MRYVELRQQFKDFTLFSLGDIRILDKDFSRARLNEWQDKGYIKKLIRGYYFLSDLETNENVLFQIANRLYSPSYVSLQTALSYFGLIPETVYGITSVSTRKTSRFGTPLGEFIYRTITPRMFFGYDLVKWHHKCFRMATVEKAIVDYFYLTPALREKNDFAALRINRDIFFERVTQENLYSFLDRFGQKTLTKRIHAFWEHMEHD